MIAALVEDTLACLAAEHAEAHARFVTSLGPRRIAARVNAEDLEITFGITTRTIHVATDIATLCDVLHGKVEMLDAVIGGRLDIIGEPSDLVALSDAMHWFVQGVLRCVSTPKLLDRLIALRTELHDG